MAKLTFPSQLLKNVPFIKQNYDLDYGYNRAVIEKLIHDPQVIKDSTRTEWRVNNDERFYVSRTQDAETKAVTFTSNNASLSLDDVGLSQAQFHLLTILACSSKGEALQGGVLSINAIALRYWLMAGNMALMGGSSNFHRIHSVEPMVITHQHCWHIVIDTNVKPGHEYQQDKLIFFDDSFDIIERDNHYYPVLREQVFSITIGDELFDVLSKKARSFLQQPKSWNVDKLVFIYPFLENPTFQMAFVKAIVRVDDEMYKTVIHFFHSIDPANAMALQDAIIKYRNTLSSPQPVFASKSFWESKNVTHFSLRDKQSAERINQEYQTWKKSTLQEIFADKLFWEGHELKSFSTQDEEAVERLIADYKEWQSTQLKKKNA